MRFRRETIAGAAALALAGFITISCGGVNDPSKNTAQDLVVTVAARGGQSNIQTFNISNSGEYSVKVTASNPTFSGTFALNVGIGDASSCGIIQQNFFATVNGASLGGPVAQKGLYCVFVADINGSFTQTPISFTIQASHP